MTLMQRIKRDKKFRFKFMIGTIILFALITSASDKKTSFQNEEICNAIGSLSPVNDLNQCNANACSFNWGGFADWDCNSCTPNGRHTWNPELCCSGAAIEDQGIDLIPIIDLVPNSYTCKAALPSQTCNANERDIAGFVQDLGLFKTNCKYAYYSAIVAGGLIAVMMLGVIL